jgi:hypothetical protein
MIMAAGSHVPSRTGFQDHFDCRKDNSWMSLDVARGQACLSRQNSTGRDHCTAAPNIKGVNGTGTYFAGFSGVSLAIPQIFCSPSAPI